MRFQPAVDEAGARALAGRYMRAAVILPACLSPPPPHDNKTLTPTHREESGRLLLKKIALAYTIAEVSVEAIDRLNVLRATLLGMAQAVTSLAIRPAIVARSHRLALHAATAPQVIA